MPEFYLTALNNLGNTCYMNSAIQALFATDEFMVYMVETKSDKKLHSSLSKLFKDMIECGKSKDRDCMSADAFRDVFVKIKPEFNNNEQHDSQEFLKLLIDGLHEEVNEAKTKERPKDLPQGKTPKEAWDQYIKYFDDSFLVKLFVGHLRSSLECKKCNHKSQRWDTFWDISLSFPEKRTENISITSLLKEYQKDEVLSGDAMPTCDNCKTKTEAIKSTAIERLPLILTINLKRFGNDGHKLSENIEINERIYLKHTSYDLYSCICHQGSNAGSGHYAVLCHYYTENWYLFDDTYIENLGAFSLEKLRDFLKDSYILFYRMTDVTIHS